MALFGGKKKGNADSFGMMPPPPGMPDQGQQDMGMPPDPYGQNYYQQGQQDQAQDPGYMPDMGMPPDMSQQPPSQYPGPMQDPYAQQFPEQAQQPMSFPPPYFQQPFPAQDDTKERVEEIAEAIIDEKWNELIRDINKVVEWKERTDGEIKKLQQEIQDLKERFESLHSGVLGRITEYDQNLTTVGSEIKAMEMAFQKILPSFIENIGKLDRIVKNSPAPKEK